MSIPFAGLCYRAEGTEWWGGGIPPHSLLDFTRSALDFREWCVVLGISITSEEESEVDTVTSLIALITFTTHLLSGFSYLLP